MAYFHVIHGQYDVVVKEGQQGGHEQCLQPGVRVHRRQRRGNVGNTWRQRQIGDLSKPYSTIQTAARVATFHFCKHKEKPIALNYDLQAKLFLTN